MQGAETIMAVGLTEAARRLGVSPRTVATLVARGELYSRRIGRRRVIPVRALEMFLNETHIGRVKSNAD
jgi:excisionase family DNA binding protein